MKDLGKDLKNHSFVLRKDLIKNFPSKERATNISFSKTYSSSQPYGKLFFQTVTYKKRKKKKTVFEFGFK